MTIKAFSFSFSLGILLFLANSTVTHAVSPLSWQDNFDSGNLNKWKTVRNQQWINPSKPCEWYAQAADWVNDGTRAGIMLYGNPCITELAAQGLDLRNIDHYVVGFDLTLSESSEMDRGFVFAWLNQENYYALKQFGSEVKVLKLISGHEVPLINSSAQFAFAANHTYRVEVDVQLGKRIVVSIDHSPILDIVDSDAQFSELTTPITIALQAGTGALPKTVELFDNLSVESLTESATLLAIKPWKQTDPVWATQEYDHATTWTDKPTIQRWGCALTSVASILHFYGIQKLPNDQLLTPASLNTWLNAQPDGYLGEGAVNWLAITRLTQQMSPVLGTPKLEYSWHPADENTAKEEIKQNQPPILEIPGHFMVGSGIDSNQNILIHDPAYAFTRLNQHKQSLVSVREFKPSHTDLSYMLFSSATGTQVEVRNQQNQIVSSSTTEMLKDPVSGNTTHPIQITMVSKPADEAYQITIKQSQDVPYQVRMLTYDQQATVTQQTISGKGNQAGDIYTLELKKKGNSKIEQQISWLLLKTHIERLKKQKAFERAVIANELLSAVQLGPKLPLKAQRYLLETMQLCIKLSRFWIKPEANQLLTQQIQLFLNQLKK